MAGFQEQQERHVTTASEEHLFSFLCFKKKKTKGTEVKTARKA